MEEQILIASEPDSLRRESSRRRVSGLSKEEKTDRKKARKEVPRDNVLGFQEPPTPGMPLDINGYIKSKRGKEVRFIMVKKLRTSDCNEKMFLKLDKKTVRRGQGRSSRRFREEKYHMLVGEWEGFAKENGLRPGYKVKLWPYRFEREDREDLAISKIGEKITEHVVTDSESGKDTVIVQKGSVQLIYN